MKVQTFSLIGACLTSLITACAPEGTTSENVSAAAKIKKPNVLLILVDDLKPAIAAYGDANAITPNMDALMAKGVRFDKAFANQAVCMASRYNLMLGSRSSSTGIYSFGTDLREAYPNAVTLPQQFKAAGYHAEGMGKVYHIGHGSDDDAASWSVPHYKERVIEYVDPINTAGGITREEAYFNEGPVPDGVGINDLPRGAGYEDPDVTDEAYADGRIAVRAGKRLADLSKADYPFFLAVGFARPHLPFSAPKSYWDMYDPQALPMPAFTDFPKGAPPMAVKPDGGGEIRNFTPMDSAGNPMDDALTRTLIHGYYASVSYVDAQIGKVLDAVEANGLADNTIIALWGDHGFHLGDHRQWTKHTNYEEANRIPLIFAGPGIASGEAAAGIAETVDVYATLLGLAGITPIAAQQPLDGSDLSPGLAAPDTVVNSYAYHSYPRKGVWLGEAIRTGRYRLVRWTSWKDPKADMHYELYDYVDDPLEKINIADTKPEAFAALMAILEQHPPAKEDITH